MLETIDLKYLLHLRHYFVLQFIGYIVKSFNIWGWWVKTISKNNRNFLTLTIPNGPLGLSI